MDNNKSDEKFYRHLAGKLRYAVRKGRLQLVKDIVDYTNLSTLHQWLDEFTLLCLAINKKHTNILQILATKCGDLVNNNRRNCDTPLHYAVKTRDLQSAAILLNNGANVDAQNKQGLTPLHYAISQIEMVVLLLSHHANVKTKSRRNRTILHIAAEKGCKNTVKLLLSYKAEVEAIDHDGNTPLSIAVIRNHPDIVAILIKHGANVNTRTEYGQTILHFSVKSLMDYICNHHDPCTSTDTILNNAISVFRDNRDINHPDFKNVRSSLKIFSRLHRIIEALVANGANVDLADQTGKTPLEMSVRRGFTYIIEILLKHGANVNLRGVTGSAPLHIAVEGNQHIVKLLLNYDCNVNLPDSRGRTALEIAIKYRHYDVVIPLLKRGANVFTRTAEGRTPLHIAAEGYDYRIVAALLEHGARINVRDYTGMTPLHLACEDPSCYRTVKLLLECGARYDSKDHSGKIPLHIAANCGREDVVRLLLNCGSHIDAQDLAGETALHLACREHDVIEVSDALIKYGADVNVVCKENRTALYYDEKGTISRQIIRLKVANLFVAKQNTLEDYNMDEMIFFQFCQEEVVKMKVTRIGNSHVTFYRFLSGNLNDMATFAENNSIKKFFQTDSSLKQTFPLYANMITNNLLKGQQRILPLQTAMKVFHEIFDPYNQLPDHCIENIFN